MRENPHCRSAGCQPAGSRIAESARRADWQSADTAGWAACATATKKGVNVRERSAKVRKSIYGQSKPSHLGITLGPSRSVLAVLHVRSRQRRWDWRIAHLPRGPLEVS